MYSREIDTFIVVAECGSFNQAARKLFISVPSVVQQINILEKRLNATLLIRSKRGITLTAAGRIFYEDSLKLVQFCRDTMSRIRNVRKEFLFGIGLRFTADLIQQAWPSLQARYPEVSFRFVRFESERTENDQSPDVCESMDYGRSGSRRLPSFFAESIFLPVLTEPYVLAVPPGHPLYGIDRPEPAQMARCSLLLLQKGTVADSDLLRAELQRDFPDIRIIDCPRYDTVAIEQSRMRMLPMIIPRRWHSLLPGFKISQGPWKQQTTYGFFYRKDSDPTLVRILQEIKDMLQERETRGQ